MRTTRQRLRGLSRVARCLPAAFTLIEIVVALAVILILAAVALPQLAGYLDQKKIDQTAAQLATVRDALNNSAPGSNAFFQKVTRNAGRLSELDSSLVIGDASWATGTDNSCGAAFNKAQRDNWDASGPFVSFLIERTGMQTPIGRTEDSLTRNPPGGGVGTLRINFLNNVTIPDAQLLDATVDAGDGNALGSVQWVLPDAEGDGLVTLRYFVPIGASC